MTSIPAELLARFAAAEKRTTQGNWRIRSQGRDFFIERPKMPGEAYGIEILMQEEYDTKRADAEFIVLAKSIAAYLNGTPLPILPEESMIENCKKAANICAEKRGDEPYCFYSFVHTFIRHVETGYYEGAVDVVNSEWDKVRVHPELLETFAFIVFLKNNS